MYLSSCLLQNYVQARRITINSTTLISLTSIATVFTGAWLGLILTILAFRWYWQIPSRFVYLLSTGSELVKGAVLELYSELKNVKVFYIVV